MKPWQVPLSNLPTTNTRATTNRRTSNMPKQIVIIGAGPGGLNCAQALAAQLRPQDDTDVALLEMQSFYFHAVGMPRAYVDEAFGSKLLIPYDEAIPKKGRGVVRHIRAIATKIDGKANQVVYRTIGRDDQPATMDTTISFDYLVVATGSTYTTPIKPDGDDYRRAAFEKKLQTTFSQIASSDKILIVGGGAVGCEVAGEIAVKYPHKSVTLLEGNDRLLAGADVRDKLRDKLMEGLNKLNVKVILGERLEERLTENVFKERTLRTNKGTTIQSDAQLLCAGMHPVSALVADMNKSLVTASGAIKVNDQLQLADSSFSHIYVVGDASNHSTPKLGYFAGEQGKHVAAEIIARVRGKNSTKAFPPVTVGVMLVPLGPNGGASQLPLMGGCVVGNTMTRMIKSKDYFVGRAWSDLGATLPN